MAIPSNSSWNQSPGWHRYVSALAIVHLFLPYVGGTRLRYDVALGFLCVLLAPLLRREMTAIERAFFGLSLMGAVWLGIRIVVSPGSNVFYAITFFANQTFGLISVCVWLVFRPYIRTFDDLFFPLCFVSLFSNAVAFLQWADPHNPLHKQIFALWGGHFDKTDMFSEADSFAEFLLLYAQRYTGIFNGMHALAIFNIVVISVGLVRLKIGGLLGRAKLLVIAAVLAGIAGGVISASKSFYFGLSVSLVLLLFMRQIPRVYGVLMGLSGAAVGAWIIASSKGSAVEGYFLSFKTADTESLFGPRFGENGYLRDTFRTIREQPDILLIGRGGELENFQIADNVLLPHLGMGGIPLVVMFFGSIFLLMAENWRLTRAASPWAPMFVALHVTFLAIGIGIPTYQLGRVTELLLLLNFAALISRSPGGVSATNEVRHLATSTLLVIPPFQNGAIHKFP